MLPEENQKNLAKFFYEYIVLSIPLRNVHPKNEKGERECDKEMLKKLKNYNLFVESLNENYEEIMKNMADEIDISQIEGAETEVTALNDNIIKKDYDQTGCDDNVLILLYPELAKYKPKAKAKKGKEISGKYSKRNENYYYQWYTW